MDQANCYPTPIIASKTLSASTGDCNQMFIQVPLKHYNISPQLD